MTVPSDHPPPYPPDPLSPEELAFLKDLEDAYDNPEIYGQDVPQRFNVRIISYLLTGNPTLIHAEINGDIMPDNLVEVALYLISLDPNLERTLEKYGDTDFAEFARNFEQDPLFPKWRDAQWKFFLRHFPKFLASAHHIAVMSSFIATLLAAHREEPDEELSATETLARETLEREIALLEKTIKSIVGTRSSGRPKKYATGELPEIVTRVLKIARSMMGEATGKDAVPGLKAVALELDTNEDALGKRLRDAGHPWTGLRTFLENLPAESN